jgi:hypothetical protein
MFNSDLYFCAVACFLFWGCATDYSAINSEKSVCSVWPDEISSRMQTQENAWNTGDISAFMKGAYWPNDSMLFIGKRGLTWGYEATLQNYLASYPDQASMGTLEFENLNWIKLGKNHGLLIGKWHLDRLDSLEDLSGHYSLIWERRNSSWLIIADHSS